MLRLHRFVERSGGQSRGQETDDGRQSSGAVNDSFHGPTLLRNTGITQVVGCFVDGEGEVVRGEDRRAGDVRYSSTRGAGRDDGAQRRVVGEQRPDSLDDALVESRAVENEGDGCARGREGSA